MTRKLMTRKEMLSYCIDNQIKRGIVDKSMKSIQMRYRLKGIGYAKPMSYAECVRWYEEVKAYNKEVQK